MLETAVFGAYYNVTINLKDITDTDFKTAVSVFLCSSPDLLDLKLTAACSNVKINFAVNSTDCFCFHCRLRKEYRHYCRKQRSAPPPSSTLLKRGSKNLT